MTAMAAQTDGTLQTDGTRPVGVPLPEIIVPARALTWEDVLQPDVLVARRSDDLAQRLVAPPVLAVEVLSPSSRSVDRSLERSVHEETGVEHYWLVDPEAPAVQLLALREGAYVEVGAVRGEQSLHVDAPFAVDLVPQQLVDE